MVNRDTSPAAALRRLRDGPFNLVLAVYVITLFVSLVSRVVLGLVSHAEIDASTSSLANVFLRGMVSDLAAASYFSVPFVVVALLLPQRWRDHRFYTPLRAIQYGLLWFAMLWVLVAEVLFWLEFGVRFNFIAVDYLVYTHEVLGNIKESYPVTTIVLLLALLAAVLTWLTHSFLAPRKSQRPWTARARTLAGAVLLCPPALAWFAFDGGLKEHHHNRYNNELASNGLYSFMQAFRLNELDYDRFYLTLPEASIRSLVQHEVSEAATGHHPEGNAASASIAPVTVGAPGRELRKNVVLVSVESLSAEFLGAFGNPQGLTPNLDRLAKEGMLFTNLYAVGTRTVRGLEALSAALPPLPGQSIVRRPHNENLYSLGAIFRDHGYATKFVYGGYGYFDNMNAYFAANGYEVVDRTSMPSERVGFANVWGVADEYLFTQALDEIDRSYGAGKLVFAHVMTTSNHRPYTYPAGRIDIPSKTGREGAVKYTDYAIGKFIEMAKAKPWFRDTVFLIVADHCASSAGKARLSIPHYHIPALVYAPGFVAPRRVDTLASQIDLAPTLLGLLNFSYESLFLGHDLLHAQDEEQRAFISNYQELGYLRLDNDGGKRLVVFAPPKRVNIYKLASDGETLAPAPYDAALVAEAEGYYQGANYLVKRGYYRAEVVHSIKPRSAIPSARHVIARR